LILYTLYSEFVTYRTHRIYRMFANNVPKINLNNFFFYNFGKIIQNHFLISYMNLEYHVPVMLSECLEGLNIQPDGVYVDVTFGGGGHSWAILQKLSEKGKLFSFDQDPDSVKNAQKFSQSNFFLIQSNFRNLRQQLLLHHIEKVDGILADLGVSSHQLDTAERGFSLRFEADLDMRMSPKNTLSAQKVLETYSQKELHKIFERYGEVRNARTLADEIVKVRKNQKIRTIEDFKEILKRLFHNPKELISYQAQVFQAIRIEVNEELKVLEEMLMQTPEVLCQKGRLVVMSYHSLEDRIVKNFIQKGNFEGEAQKDFYGNVLKPLQALHSKPISPTEAEIARNPRARSAKLRIAEKL
jgi:16S rRNA (cytosine1402-N4)-methyltransferase